MMAPTALQWVLVAALLVCSAVAQYPPPSQILPTATPAQQEIEKAALMAMVEAFGNHPLFEYYGWTNYQADGVTPRYPCGNNGRKQWYLVECFSGNIIGFDLGSNVFSDNVKSKTVYGYDVPAGNVSWAKDSPSYGPLKGQIPWAALQNITYLNVFSFHANDLFGPALPANINEFRYLNHVDVGFNNLNGTIPQGITQLNQITPVPLTGYRPQELSGLTFLDVSNNQMSGPLPANLDNITSLQQFSIYQNSFYGPLPAALGNISGLQFLFLGPNHFNGSLPEEWGKLSQLSYMSCIGCQLTGTIPPSYESLQNLTLLDLSQNQLSGAFPTFLGNLTRLSILVLSANQFYGSVSKTIWAPTNLTQVDISQNYINGSLVASPAGRIVTYAYQTNCITSSPNANEQSQMRNSTTCQQFYADVDPAHYGQKGSSFPVAAVVVPVVVVALLAALGICLFMWRRGSGKLDHLFGKNLKQTVKAFSLPELKRATKNFSQTIGKGGYGTVYKAILKDGTIVAVKRLDQVSKQGDVEFIREVELLSRLHHRHLVNLVGFCAEKGERVLVYEYMAMGSLYEHLHGASAKDYPLSWDSRTKIAIHIALGLEYLHYGADPPLIHRDIKSANILLSEDGYSKVADFGLCKEAPLGADGSETLVPTATAVRGSFGYLDPEYVNTSILSEKSDVYSYGVVLLELISGHKSIHEWQPLAYWAEEYLAEREKTPLMVDPALEGNFDLDELYALCDIARTCVQDQAVLRPTIRDVAKALVENLGHALSSYAGSIKDSASVLSSTQSDTSSVPSSSYPSNQDASEFSYQNYSETLHWTPPDSGKMSGSGVSNSSNANGRLPVPMPQRKAKSQTTSDTSA